MTTAHFDIQYRHHPRNNARYTATTTKIAAGQYAHLPRSLHAQCDAATPTSHIYNQQRIAENTAAIAAITIGACVSISSTGHEGAEQCQEALRRLQERKKKGREICLHYLQQESEAQAEVCFNRMSWVRFGCGTDVPPDRADCDFNQTWYNITSTHGTANGVQAMGISAFP